MAQQKVLIGAAVEILPSLQKNDGDIESLTWLCYFILSSLPDLRTTNCP